jgi:hypothetical protein
VRLHRIALSNYRGVRHAEVSPALSGVTIVQGPNEIGKSSLAEALELLFEELDSSSKARIRAIKPVDLDAGPEVEVELTTGPYHVIYTKRWKPGASTRLRLLAPKPESLTGRSAHERMTAILEETLDEGLWRALRHQQGVSITQASLGDCRTLASTLDSAAGGTVAGEDQTDLWERVQAERRLYFTAAGKPTGERVQVGARVSELSARAQALERELAELEDISVRHRELGVELATNREQQARRGELLIDQQAAWDDLQEVRGEVDNRRLIVEATAASLREVEVRLQERERSIEAVDLAHAELESLLQGATLAAPGRHAAESAQRRALAVRDEAAAPTPITVTSATWPTTGGWSSPWGARASTRPSRVGPWPSWRAVRSTPIAWLESKRLRRRPWKPPPAWPVRPPRCGSRRWAHSSCRSAPSGTPCPKVRVARSPPPESSS